MAEVNDVLGSIYMEKGRYSDLLPVLSRYRETLLGAVHRGQKQIDCLDFLIYKLKKL